MTNTRIRGGCLCGAVRYELSQAPEWSLDDDPGLAPRAHIFVSSNAPWVTITDALPQHPGALGTASTEDYVAR